MAATSVKFGTFHLMSKPEWQTQTAVYTNTLKQIKYAESLGYDSVWLTEHHFSRYGLCPDILLFAAHVAAVTKNIRIGTGVTILPFQNPIRTAESAAMVDILSNGRLDFGVGRGYQHAEFGGFNLPMKESRERFLEALDIILRAWTSSAFFYHGKFNTVSFEEHHEMLPKPVQKPYPPIYVAGVSFQTIEWAAKRQFPILTASLETFDQIKRNHELYRKELEKTYGKSKSELPIVRWVHLGDNEEQIRRDTEGPLKWYLNALITDGSTTKDSVATESYEHYKTSWERISRMSYDYMWDNILLFGTPGEVSEKISRLGETLDLSYLICWMDFGGLEPQKVKNCMRLFAKSVASQFR